MSFKPSIKKAARNIAGVSALGLAAALLMAPASGAIYTATERGNAVVKTATLSLDTGDSSGWDGAMDLTFDNLKPGETQSQTFYVKNTGSIPATVTLKKSGYTFTANMPAGTLNSPLLKAGVEGWSTMSGHNAAHHANLGVLQPGEQRAYNLLTSLDASAGNEWQGLKIGYYLDITLTQQ